MRRDVLDLALEVLDHEVVDATGLPCGIVDDVELAGDAGEPLRAVALLIGPGWIACRLAWPFNAAMRHLSGAAQVRVPWEAIHAIAERIELRGSARSYGLGEADRRWSRAIARIPGGWR